MTTTLQYIQKLEFDNAKLLEAALRGVMALEANGAPNCEAAKELRAAIAAAKGDA